MPTWVLDTRDDFDYIIVLPSRPNYYQIIGERDNVSGQGFAIQANNYDIEVTKTDLANAQYSSVGRARKRVNQINQNLQLHNYLDEAFSHDAVFIMRFQTVFYFDDDGDRRSQYVGFITMQKRVTQGVEHCIRPVLTTTSLRSTDQTQLISILERNAQEFWRDNNLSLIHI